MLAKGAAGTGMFRLRRSARLTSEVKAPRQRREDRQPQSDPRLRYHQQPRLRYHQQPRLRYHQQPRLHFSRL